MESAEWWVCGGALSSFLVLCQVLGWVDFSAHFLFYKMF